MLKRNKKFCTENNLCFSCILCTHNDSASMNRACNKRLQKEAELAQTDETIKLSHDPDDIRKWKATIMGPIDSFYENHVFDLSISVPQEYPLVPPKIMFVTKIFHPNVRFESGEICLDILKKEWSPAWSLQSSCRAILAILSDPAHDSPLNCDAGNMVS